MRDLHQRAYMDEELTASAVPAALDAELSEWLFGSLQRSGQRIKAEQYVRGLLSVQGRKTLRSIAAQLDGAAAQQSVHHFISESPWEWMPVRRALARQVQRTLAPDAWVIRPTLIPKAGSHSVGVDQQSLPLGRTVNGQHAVGTWLVSGRSAVPVDWQLRLSARWMVDPLRRRASVPADATVGTIEECVRVAVANVLAMKDVPRGPVVVDVADVDAASIARFLSSMGIAFIVRVSPEAQLRLDRSELPKYGGRERTAGELAESLPRLRQQVNPGDGPTTAVAIPVVASPSRSDRMLLLGEWGPVGHPRRRLWLTNADVPSAVPALRLTRLPGVVVRDFATISESVGVRDFAGRSFPGWHRHITLASVAHLVAALELRGLTASTGPSRR
ncbi:MULTISPECIES: transposase [unclassified Streptomyces]|uniref:IS701 family transposase n=1 Tax=unclassified Streptomyces TaxID=2593676 RepID=UPI00081DCF80|nr:MULTISPECIES: transposase [unclassified Streptomyces]SCF80795.1 SRSO17 transposase [Streptomyces sp. MnatMP-M17]